MVSIAEAAPLATPLLSAHTHAHAHAGVVTLQQSDFVFEPTVAPATHHGSEPDVAANMAPQSGAAVRRSSHAERWR